MSYIPSGWFVTKRPPTAAELEIIKPLHQARVDAANAVHRLQVRRAEVERVGREVTALNLTPRPLRVLRALEEQLDAIDAEIVAAERAEHRAKVVHNRKVRELARAADECVGCP